MPRIIIEIEWDQPTEPNWLNADNVALALHSYCKNTKFKVRETTLISSEALYGFTGWLTSRPERTVMSERDDAGAIAELVDEFCRANSLMEPREGWAENLIYP